MPPCCIPAEDEPFTAAKTTAKTGIKMAAVSPNQMVPPGLLDDKVAGRRGPSAAAGESSSSSHNKPKVRKLSKDPVQRYNDLEAELFRLKFERAQHIEKVEVQELQDRQNRDEIKRLRSHLGELDVELEGIVMKGQEGANAMGTLPEEVVVEEGLRLKKEKLELSHTVLEKDVKKMRSELEAERDRFADVCEKHEKAESDQYRADSEQKGLKSTGERLSSEQSKLQSECTSKSVELSEVRESKLKVEEELNGLRDKISLLFAEHTKLEMRLEAARDQTRAFRHDEAMSKRQSARVRDQMLSINDPEEYRRQRPLRRARRKQEKAADVAWAASEREVGRRRSNDSGERTLYVPKSSTSMRDIRPGMSRRCSNDAGSRSVCSMRSIIPGMGRRYSNEGPPRRQEPFVPGSWKKESHTESSSMSVISGLTTDSRPQRSPGGLFGNR